MGKQKNEPPRQGPARFRYIELEGSDETVQKFADTIERMRRPVEVLTRVPKRLTNSSTTEPTLFDEEPLEAEATPIEDEAPESESQSHRRERGEGGTKDYNAGIPVVGDVDFYPEGKQSLKQFFTEKSPSNDKLTCLAFCYYLQETLQLTEFGVGHVLAAFNEIPKPIPADLPGTLRNMRVGKKGSKGWLEIADINNIRVTTAGMNQVRHKMGSGTLDGGVK